MITLGKLAAQIIEDLSGGRPSKDTPYRMPYVIQATRQALNSELLLTLLQKRGGPGYDDDRSTVGAYIANYPNTDIEVETSTSREYVKVPDFFISLKYNKGIHGLADMNNPLKRFIPIHNPGVASHLPSFELEEANYGYYHEGDKLYLTRRLKKKANNGLLLQLIVAAPSKYGEDDILPITPEVEGRVVAQVKETVYKRVVQDRIIDDNKDLGVNVNR